MAPFLISVVCDASAARDAAGLAANAASSPEAAAAASRAARSAAAAASRASRSARAAVASTRRCSLPYDPVPGLDVTDKDLASDEAVWALYEHWCKAYNKERDHDEMTRRLPIFKETATLIQGSRLGKYADGLDKHDNPRKEVIDFWEREYKRLGVSM